MAVGKTIDVVVAVVVNASNEVLVSFRHASLHQGNLWEFPGGKIEPGESVKSALHRELMEELGLVIRQCFPLQTINYKYPDKSVRLHVWRITEWTGVARGLEGQKIAWHPVSELDSLDFPAANAPIVKILQLPALIAVTPIVASLPELESVIDGLLRQGITLIQLRQPQLSAASYLHWFQCTSKLCEAQRVSLMFNGELRDFSASGAIGYHANSQRLLALDHRPVAAEILFSTSCHSLEELQHAAALSADFATLSPVAVTYKYPVDKILGWPMFRELTSQVSIPVYALGGLCRDDLVVARSHGAQGICGISLFQP